MRVSVTSISDDKLIQIRESDLLKMTPPEDNEGGGSGSKRRTNLLYEGSYSLLQNHFMPKNPVFVSLNSHALLVYSERDGISRKANMPKYIIPLSECLNVQKHVCQNKLPVYLKSPAAMIVEASNNKGQD